MMKKLVTVFLFAVIAQQLYAQVEPHFSQYYMYPLWLNPALTGAIDGDYRVAVIHRDQWKSISNGFTTNAISADFVTKKNVNIGVNLLQQNAGDAGYKYGNGQISLAYTGVRFGKDGDKVVTLALQGGLLSRRFDFSKAQTDNQFNGGTYDPSIPSGETLGKPSASSLDFGAGAMYYDGDPDKKVNIFAGFSAGHINEPKDPSLSVGEVSKLPVRYTVHGGANIYLSEKANLVPNFLYMKQGTSNEAMIGGYVQMAANTSTDLSAGLNYRLKDAFYPYLGMRYNNFTVGLSYDVNSSQLGKLVNGASSFEISLMYMDKTRSKGFFKCPRF
jgi:type IX secretion system PorP/SprF family membrane protein